MKGLPNYHCRTQTWEDDKGWHCSGGENHEIAVEIFHPEQTYCRTCILKEKAEAEPCPYCGIKKGFAMGTGDCGCEEDYY